MANFQTAIGPVRNVLYNFPLSTATTTNITESERIPSGHDICLESLFPRG